MISIRDLFIRDVMMYDFRTMPNLEGWTESSDTVRRPGMSKGAFVLQVQTIKQYESKN